MKHTSDLPRSPTVLRIRVPVAADGTVTAFGLTYRPEANPATLGALALAGHAALLVDPVDVGTVLVRDLATGGLFRADCTRHAYACGLSLPVHAAARRTLRAVPCRAALPVPHPSDPTSWHDGAGTGSGGRPDASSTPLQVM